MSIASFITPVNLQSEQEKFFTSATYHPHFEYDFSQRRIDNLLQEFPEYKNLITALVIQDHEMIVRESKKVFETEIEEAPLKTAKKIVSHCPDKLPTQNAKQVAAAFLKAIEFLELGYKLIISDERGFNFRPQHSKKIIQMSSHAKLDFYSVDGEIKHELVHVIRQVNGLANIIPYSHQYLSTEEGLATYMQDYKGEFSQGALFQHASEYVVTEVCLKDSLRNAFEYLVSIGWEKELAFQRAVRHKFGFINTSLPGDIMKPAMYFHHEQKIKHLTNYQLIRLFVGKIRLDEIETYPVYKGSVSLEKIKQFYSL